MAMGAGCNGGLQLVFIGPCIRPDPGDSERIGKGPYLGRAL